MSNLNYFHTAPSKQDYLEALRENGLKPHKQRSLKGLKKRCQKLGIEVKRS